MAKTIKELADDYALHCEADDDAAYRGFQAGANYVLEEIENVIKSDRILGHPFPSLEMRYNQIISAIEQLKQ